MAMIKTLPKSWPLLAGSVIIAVIFAAAIWAPQLATHNPNQQQLQHRLKAPGAEDHMLGTDGLGRDVWSRLIYGSRISLLVGLISVTVGASLGTVIGLLAGYFGGIVDTLLSRLIDVIMAFPTILLALAIIAALGPSLVNSIIAVGVASAPGFARVVRGVVLSVRERDYIQAATALGSADLRTLLRHVLPNVNSPLIVLLSVGTGSAILVEASLSFLGLGVAPPTATWGSMITDGKQYMDSAPWISVFSGLAIALTVLGFNLLGDGLRDTLDTRL